MHASCSGWLCLLAGELTASQSKESIHPVNLLAPEIQVRKNHYAP